MSRSYRVKSARELPLKNAIQAAVSIHVATTMEIAKATKPLTTVSLPRDSESLFMAIAIKAIKPKSI